jgi:putative redox protein
MTQQQLQFDNHLGETLAGTLHMPESPTTAGVVLGHCFTCSRHTGILRQIAADLATAGIAALRFDFSGNGQSAGDFAQSSFSKHLQEIATAAELLRERGAQAIGLAGHSMGASLAVIAGSQLEGIRTVCALAGRLSGADPSRFLSETQITTLLKEGVVAFESRGRSLQLSQNFVSDAEQFDLPDILENYAIPLLVVHGEQDEIVPVSEAVLAREANPRQVDWRIIANADHMFSNPDHRRQVSELVIRWFETHLKKGPP